MTEASAEDLSKPWESWSGVCGLLGQLWLRELDEPTLRLLNQQPVRDLYLQVGGWLPPPLCEPSVDSWLEQLGEDYCRLFVGPRGHRPPVQSVWQQGTFEGQAAESMEQYWQLLGWKPKTIGPSVPADHLGLQWLTLAYGMNLCHLALQKGDPSREELPRLVTAFYRDHVAWGLEPAQWVQERAQTEFYRHLGQVTAGFLQHLNESLASLGSA